MDITATKRALASLAETYLRGTPDYADALEHGEGREWLALESWSYAESAHALLLERLEEAGCET